MKIATLLQANAAITKLRKMEADYKTMVSAMTEIDHVQTAKEVQMSAWDTSRRKYDELAKDVNRLNLEWIGIRDKRQDLREDIIALHREIMEYKNSQ